MKKRAIVLSSVLSISIVAGIVWASVPNGPQPSVSIYWYTSSDPTTGAGVVAPLAQLLVRQDVPSVYYKSGAAATAWTKIGAGAGGGGGTVTSVACGVGLSCAPAPIVGAGTVALDITPTTCSAGMAEVSTASDGTSACATFASTDTGTPHVLAAYTAAGTIGNSLGPETDDGTTFSVGAHVTVADATGITAISTTVAGTSSLNVTQNTAGDTSNVGAVTLTGEGTRDTTAGVTNAPTLIVRADSTKSAGASALNNIAIFADATGGDGNYDFYSDLGIMFQTGSASFGSDVAVNNGQLSARAGFSSVLGLSALGATTGTVIRPTTSGPINNWNPAGLSTARYIFVSPSAPTTITGIVAGLDGQELDIFNVGSSTLTLRYETGSSPGNQFNLTSQTDWSVNPAGVGQGPEHIALVYDAANGFWTQMFTADFPGLSTSGTLTFTGGRLEMNGLNITDVGNQTVDGFIIAQGTVPTLTGCGTTGATATGGAYSGVITTTAGATTCVASFTASLAGTASCRITDRAGLVPPYTPAASGLTFTAIATHVYDWSCHG